MLPLLATVGPPALVLAATTPAADTASASWQTPVALLIVATTAAALLYRAWRKHQRSSAGCGSSSEGCGCDTLKKSLRK